MHRLTFCIASFPVLLGLDFDVEEVCATTGSCRAGCVLTMLSFLFIFCYFDSQLDCEVV
ncbi:hypothetical protein M758_UG068500 [Ceratodon purpureus]|nr:hypothetical protein M758_UG068500 [Ceratodon purpureus]